MKVDSFKPENAKDLDDLMDVARIMRRSDEINTAEELIKKIVEATDLESDRIRLILLYIARS